MYHHGLINFVVRYLPFASMLTFYTANAQGGSCNACNCQFGNMDVLDQYTEAIVDARLAAAQRNETGKTSNLAILEKW